MRWFVTRRMFAGMALSGLAACAISDYSSMVGLKSSDDEVLHGICSNNGTGFGTITVLMSDGETLTGKYATADVAIYTVASIYAGVGGTGGGNAALGVVPLAGIPNTSSGAASLSGDRGSVLACGYFVNHWTGSGAGVCRSASGAQYRLYF